jgi:predicted Co/Zn/Cd cation transporter (cation efflux family)
MNPMDRWTQLLDKVLNLFLVDSPNRTGLGVAIGLFVHVLILIFEPMLTLAQLNLTRLPMWAWPVIGVVAMNARAIRASLKEESVGNEQIDLAIRVIKKAKMSPAAERHQYILLIAKVIEGLDVSPKRTTDLRTD